jgi:hypothetical protein
MGEDRQMRKLIIAVVLVLFSFSGANARLLKAYGFKAGVVVANQDFDYFGRLQFDTKARSGLSFGVFAEWLSLRSLSILTEAHYIQKGYVSESVQTDEFGTPIRIFKFDHRVDYLSIPLLAKVTLRTKHLSPYLIVGPRFDFLLGYKSETLDEVYRDLKDLDVGGTIGLGVESRSQPVKVLLEFRYSPNFTNAYQTDLLKVKNNSFEILFGVRR